VNTETCIWHDLPMTSEIDGKAVCRDCLSGYEQWIDNHADDIRHG